MRTFVQKPKASQQATPANSKIPSRAHLTQSRDVNSILHLQRTIGNQAVQRLLQSIAEELNAGLTGTASPHLGHDLSGIPISPPTAEAIRTKLAINTPGDEYEQEANRVAEQVMRMPEPAVQRGRSRPEWCAASSDRLDGDELVRKIRIGTISADVTEAPPIVNEVLRSPGEPLDDSTRCIMEARFGHVFRDVLVHKDARAARSAHAVNARAYTVGHDIVFATGQYRPDTADGAKLLAHELAHVAQQRPQSTQRPVPANQVQRQEKDNDSLPVVRSTVLRAPPTFQQDALTCWAAAIASWLLVKGIVKQGFSDKFLIDYYEGTSCVDDSGMLVGEDAIEGVFAEWRLLIDMGAEIQHEGLDAAMVEKLLRQHGHFILGTGSGTLHTIVVYGIEVHKADDPLQYSLLVMDPKLGVNEKKHHMFLDYPVRVAVGLPKSGGPAPCRRA